MRKTLYLKFILAYLIFGFFAFSIVAFYVPRLTEEHLTREKASAMYKEANIIAQDYASELYLNEIDLETVTNQLGMLSIYLQADIRIINPSGRVILDTMEEGVMDHTVIIKGFDPTFTGNSYYNIGDFFGQFSEEKLNIIVPITAEFKVQGYVVIHMSMADIHASSNSLMNISYITLVILILLSMIILIFFSELVYKPLKKITQAAEQYAEGNMHYEFQVYSEDEIGYLAACLSYMASEIAKAEDNQKKFVANVSHDFRSPLTSIRGYLEAMLDGTIPPELH